jgi:prephenate dehydrogenase
MKVAVIGLGLLGGSFALGLREIEPGVHVTGIDIADVLARPAARRAADELVLASDAPAVDAAVAAADLTLLAAPVCRIVALIPRVLAVARLLTDCGSTKGSIVKAAAASPRRGRFVPGHPMAGAPSGGIDLARPDLFHGRRWLLCSDGADPDAFETVEAIVRRLGADPVRIDADAHDRAVALTSHATQLVASALAAVAAEQGAEVTAGPAFEGATRVAGGPPEMWGDILSTNAGEIERALAALVEELEAVRRGLREEPADIEPALALLARARLARGR